MEPITIYQVEVSNYQSVEHMWHFKSKEAAERFVKMREDTTKYENILEETYRIKKVFFYDK